MFGIICYIILIVLISSGAIGSDAFLLGLLIGGVLILIGYMRIIKHECTPEKNEKAAQQRLQKYMEEQRKLDLHNGFDYYYGEDDK